MISKHYGYNIIRMSIVAFDIGIKNLAWCCGTKENDKITIKGWSNENLLSGGTADSDALKNKCESCKSASKFYSGTRTFCVRHSNPQALRDLSGNLLKKIPAMAILKGIALRTVPPPVPADLKSKASLLSFLGKHYSFPIESVKVKKVVLEDIHDGIRAVVLKNSELFSSAKEIILENQPAFKNPVMKSVQMMLFATLRDLLEPRPPVRLVHAGRKTTGEEKGDEGYASRKNASEKKIQDGLDSKKIIINSPGKDSAWFSKQAKKSDLADCACMVMDALNA
jgi:hypothetical protein